MISKIRFQTSYQFVVNLEDFIEFNIQFRYIRDVQEGALGTFVKYVNFADKQVWILWIWTRATIQEEILTSSLKYHFNVPTE